MIKTFKHKGLEKYFFRNERRLLNPRHISKIGRVLDVLDEVD